MQQSNKHANKSPPNLAVTSTCHWDILILATCVTTPSLVQSYNVCPYMCIFGVTKDCSFC